MAKYWDKCWNPWIGCRPCSPACENCYAAALARRFKMSFEPHITNQKPPRSGVVFCGNMTDLFGEWVQISESFRILSELFHFDDKPHSSPKPNDATYLFLTKRVERMLRALNQYAECENAYFGFTAENQEMYDERFDTWRAEKPDRVKGWLSAEPLLGPIDLGLGYIAPEDIPFKWVVVGCESGRCRRPCDINWVIDIVNQCGEFGIPVFVKQLSILGKCVNDIRLFPNYLRIRQVPWEVK